MKKKIVGILFVTLMLCCTISTARVINTGNKTGDNNKVMIASSNFGDMFLYPPWSNGCTWAGWKEDNAGYGGEVTCDGYEGDIYLWVWASGLSGAAGVNGFITHHQNPNYVAPCDGHYDFTFTYRYYGYLDIHASGPFEFDAVVETDIFIKFVLRVMSSPDSYVKEITLDEGEYHEDHSRDWDDTGDVSFNDIYVSEGTEVFLSVTMFVDKLVAAVAGAESNANGQVDLHGELKKIKIVSPCNTPPNAPTIKGPAVVKEGVVYPYEFVSNDPDGDDVSYFIDWGDGDTTGWTSYQPSGNSIIIDNKWYASGNYVMKAKARDKYGEESSYSTLAITVTSKSRVNSNNVLVNLLNKMSNAFPIFRYLFMK